MSYKAFLLLDQGRSFLCWEGELAIRADSGSVNLAKFSNSLRFGFTICKLRELDWMVLKGSLVLGTVNGLEQLSVLCAGKQGLRLHRQ